MLVTGDVKYHEARAALAQGLALIDAPHDVTEQEAVLRWAETAARRARPGGVRVETYRDPAVAVWRLGRRLGEAAPPPRRARPRRRPRRPHWAPSRADRSAGAPRRRRRAPSRRAAVNRDDDRYHLYTDGGARGNPGPAGIGARLLTAAGDVVEELADSIGTATNNVAEYQALLAGLEIALDRGVERLDVFLDSELVVRQVNGEYKVKDAGLKPLHQQACRLLHQVPRGRRAARAPRAERRRRRASSTRRSTPRLT